jgi:hypothetical protein
VISLRLLLIAPLGGRGRGHRPGIVIASVFARLAGGRTETVTLEPNNASKGLIRRLERTGRDARAQLTVTTGQHVLARRLVRL